MRGHVNEKNFVGLTTDGQHMVCGSENNKLYLYYKYTSEPLLSFDFSTKAVDNLTSSQPSISRAQTPNVDSTFSSSLGLNTSQPTGNFNNVIHPELFVSAVCWKKVNF